MAGRGEGWVELKGEEREEEGGRGEGGGREEEEGEKGGVGDMKHGVVCSCHPLNETLCGDVRGTMYIRTYVCIQD